MDALYLTYSLNKVQINWKSRSLLKPFEEILKTCTYFLSSIRQLSLPRISSPSRKIKKLSAKKSCRKYYRGTADTGSWLKNVIITTKVFAVYIHLIITKYKYNYCNSYNKKILNFTLNSSKFYSYLMVCFDTVTFTTNICKCCCCHQQILLPRLL